MIRAAVLVYLLSALPALAEKISVFVPRADGNGVSEYIGQLSAEEAAIVLGDRDPPAGATGVILEPGKPPRWTSLTPEEVNELYDGEGRPEIVPFPDEEGGGPSGPGIVLREGTWIARFVSQETSGCPAGVDEAVAAQLPALDGTPVVPSPGPNFDPATLTPEFDWSRTGPNEWVGTLEMAGRARVDRRVTVASPDLIKTWQRFQMALPGGGSCNSTTIVDLMRQG